MMLFLVYFMVELCQSSHAEVYNTYTYHSPRSYRPKPAFRGINELNHYSQHGRRFTHSLDHHSGVRMNYDVTLREGVYQLDHDDHIIHIDCINNETVIIHSSDPIETQDNLYDMKFIVGDDSWGCSSGRYTDMREEPLYRSIEGMVMDGNVLVLSTFVVPFTHLFEKSSIRLYIPPLVNSDNGDFRTEGKDNDESWFARSESETFSFNYDESTGRAEEGSIDIPYTSGTCVCEQCYAYFTPGITFEMDIDYAYYLFPYVDYLKMLFTGEAEVSAYVRLTAPPEGKSDEIELSRVFNMGAWTFSVGIVPLVIIPRFQLLAQFEVVESTLDASLFGGYTASASVEYGIEIADSDGEVNVIESDSWSYSGTPLSLSSSKSGGTFNPRIYIIPRLYMSPYGIIDFYVDPKPYLGVEIWDAASGEPDNSNPGSGNVNDYNNADKPSKPSNPPTLVSVTHDSILLALTPPASDYEITSYEVKYTCSSCWFADSFTLSSIGFFERWSTTTARYPNTEPKWVVNLDIQIEDTQYDSNEILCADKCRTYDSCVLFTFIKSNNYLCMLYDTTDPGNKYGTNYKWDDYYSDALTYELLGDDDSGRSYYELRDGDLLGFTAEGDNDSEDTIHIDVSDSDYEIWYRAYSARGFSDWSDELDVEMELDGSLSLLYNYRTLRVYITTNIAVGETITVRVYESTGAFESENYLYGFYYVYQGNSYLDLDMTTVYSNDPVYAGDDNTQEVYVTFEYEDYSETTSQITYNPVSSFQYLSSTTTKVKFKFYADPALVSKIKVYAKEESSWFSSPTPVTYTFDPLSSYCDSTHLCTVSCTWYDDHIEWSVDAYDVVGNTADIISFEYELGASALTLRYSDSKGEVNIGGSPPVRRFTTKSDSHAVANNEVGTEHDPASLQHTAPKPFGSKQSKSTLFPFLSEDASSTYTSSMSRASTLDSRGRPYYHQQTKEFRLVRNGQYNNSLSSRNLKSGRQLASDTCASSVNGLSYSFYVGLAVQVGMAEVSVPYLGLVVFESMQSPQFSIFAPTYFTSTFWNGCMEFPEQKPQIVVASPKHGDKWGVPSDWHVVEWDHWSIDDYASVSVCFYQYLTNTYLFCGNTVASGSYEISLSSSYFSVGSQYYVKVSTSDGVVGQSDYFTAVDPSEDPEVGEELTLSEMPKNDVVVEFSGLMFQTGSLSFSLQDGTKCQAHYKNFPLNVLCEAVIGIDVDSNTVLSFTVFAGAYIEDLSQLTAAGMDMTWGVTFPEFDFPSGSDSTVDYFFEQLAGTTLTSSSTFPGSEGVDMLKINVGEDNELCLRDLMEYLQDDNDDVTSDIENAVNRVTSFLDMLGMSLCLNANIANIDSENQGIEIDLTLDFTVFDKDEIAWEKYFDSIENDKFQTFLMLSGSFSEDMCASVFDQLLELLDLSSSVSYSFDIGSKLVDLYESYSVSDGRRLTSDDVQFVDSSGTFLLGSAATGGVNLNPTSDPTIRATDKPTPEPTYQRTAHPTLPGCDSPYVGDGYCDDTANNEVCAWDGGDCCENTCVPTPTYSCGYNGYDCKVTVPTPTFKPTVAPTASPSRMPTYQPTIRPTPSPTSYPTLKPTISPYPTMTGCNVNFRENVGDGYCDRGGGYNTAECNWDGGDCCDSTCLYGRKYPCGSNGYNCIAFNPTLLPTSSVPTTTPPKPATDAPTPNPTNAPLSSPTPRPTPKHIPLAVTVYFDAMETINGLSADDFDDAAQLSFRITTADSMRNLTYDMIDIDSIDDNGDLTTGHAALSSRRVELIDGRLLSGSVSCNISYTVTVLMDDFSGYSDSSDLAIDIQQAINEQYIDPSTASEFVSTAVSLGSTTISPSTTASFSVAEFGDTFTTIGTYSPTPAGDTDTHGNGGGGGGNGVDFTVVIVTVTVALVILCVLAGGYWYFKIRGKSLNRAAASETPSIPVNETSSSIELKTTPQSTEFVNPLFDEKSLSSDLEAGGHDEAPSEEIYQPDDTSGSKEEAVY